MDITVLEPDDRFDQSDYAVWLEEKRASINGVLVGRGATRQEALRAAVREQILTLHRLSEMLHAVTS